MYRVNFIEYNVNDWFRDDGLPPKWRFHYDLGGCKLGPRCKFYHGSYAELRKYKGTEYVEVSASAPVAKPNKSKNKKYVFL